VIFRGPNINPKVSQRLIELCEQYSIPYQLAAIGRATPNDANVLQIHGSGVATGWVATPNRYMHSAVKVVSLKDIQHVDQLLAELCARVILGRGFYPRTLIPRTLIPRERGRVEGPVIPLGIFVAISFCVRCGLVAVFRFQVSSESESLFRCQLDGFQAIADDPP